MLGDQEAPSMERLTAEDRLMLWPDERWPQEIGVLAVLDGASLFDPGGRFRIEAVRQAVEARLHLVPRFRQILHMPGRGLGGPLWVDDAAFDLADHVRVASMPAPGDEAALLGVAERLRRARLDRSRPLWEMWFLTGLPERQVGLFARMHHAIADGIAGVAALGTFLDPAAGAPAGPARPWTPAPMPSARALLADNLRRRAAGLGGAFSALARPVTTARQARAAFPAMRGLFSALPAPRTSLDQQVGPGRRLAVIRGSLDLVRQAAHRHGATVNDVLLAITAAGLHGLLRSRGEPVENLTLPVYVPVTLRQAQHRDQARGNLIGQMVVPLHIGEPDPGWRLEQIAAESARQKAESHPNLGTMFRSRLARRALLAFLRRHPVSVTTADVPGPPIPVYLAGARVLEVFPVLPLIGNVTIGVGALSYAGQFTITVVADRDAVPDLDTFAAAARRELRALCEPVSANVDTATPPRRSAPRPVFDIA
jgi:diacylglycerol O-acyltransferase / wax synthase